MENNKIKVLIFAKIIFTAHYSFKVLDTLQRIELAAGVQC